MKPLPFDLPRWRRTFGGSPSSPAPPSACDFGAQQRPGVLRTTTDARPEPASTIDRPHMRVNESSTSNGRATDARAWLLPRLRWERRLAELRADHERART
jgi:hypothetical protein